MEQVVREAADRLMESIHESEVYRRYQEIAEKLKKEPQVFERILDLRARTIDVYHGSESGDFLERSDELIEDYDELLRHPYVNEFLETEEELVKMLQELHNELFLGVDLYLPSM